MKTKIALDSLHLFYGDFQALKGITMDIAENQITAFIGPSGCGKSTCIKTLNRMNDLVAGCRITGKVSIDGEDIYDPRTDVTLLRKRAGMVFQKPNPFPMSIYDNIAYGPRVHGVRNKRQLDEVVEKSLRGAALWDEVKDRLKSSALGMSGGQQQRLCIARALAVEPDILLMDEPFGALDAQTRYAMEQELRTIWEKERRTVLFVTNNIEEAIYLGDRVVVMSALPGRVKTEYAIDIPAPRNYTDPAFLALRKKVSDDTELVL